MTHVFLGVTIVGLIMTMKVIMDGLHAVAEINDRIAALRISTQHYMAQKLEEESKIAAAESEVAQIKSEVGQLEETEKNINSHIQDLRATLDGRKFKVDIF
jgi:ubiquinone biosynthesis protein UbiJ